MWETVIYKYTIELVFYGIQFGKFCSEFIDDFHTGSKGNHEILIVMKNFQYGENFLSIQNFNSL